MLKDMAQEWELKLAHFPSRISYLRMWTFIILFVFNLSFLKAPSSESLKTRQAQQQENAGILPSEDKFKNFFEVLNEAKNPSQLSNSALSFDLDIEAFPFTIAEMTLRNYLIDSSCEIQSKFIKKYNIALHTFAKSKYVNFLSILKACTTVEGFYRKQFQFMSMNLRHYLLPEDAREIWSAFKENDSSDPLKVDDIEKTLTSALGFQVVSFNDTHWSNSWKESDRFIYIEKKRLAAASIGQVHKALLDIKYTNFGPNLIDRKNRRWYKIAGFFVKQFRKLLPKKYTHDWKSVVIKFRDESVKEIFESQKQMIEGYLEGNAWLPLFVETIHSNINEMNLYNEYKNLFHGKLDNSIKNMFTVPQVYAVWGNKKTQDGKIVAMDYTGDNYKSLNHVKNDLDLMTPQVEKDLGYKMIHLLLHQALQILFGESVLHDDLHDGNIMVLIENNRIKDLTLIDFGNANKMAPHVQSALQNFYYTALYIYVGNTKKMMDSLSLHLQNCDETKRKRLFEKITKAHHKFLKVDYHEFTPTLMVAPFQHSIYSNIAKYCKIPSIPHQLFTVYRSFALLSGSLPKSSDGSDGIFSAIQPFNGALWRIVLQNLFYGRNMQKLFFKTLWLLFLTQRKFRKVSREVSSDEQSDQMSRPYANIELEMVLNKLWNDEE